MTYILSPLAGLGGGISWRPPAYSLLDNRTRIQSYGALPVLHHLASGWNCVTVTTNTNRNPETNLNIDPPSLTSHLTYPRHPTCLLALAAVNSVGRYKTHGVPRPTVIGHFGASSYTGWPKKWGDCV